MEIRLGESPFRAEVAGGGIDVQPGGAGHSDAVIDTDPPTIAALIRRQRRMADALRDGRIRVDGDESPVAYFLTLFPRPH